MTKQEIIARLREETTDRIALEQAIKRMKAALENLSDEDKELAFALMRNGIYDLQGMTLLLLDDTIKNKHAAS